MPASQRRHDRVAAAIHEEVARFILDGARDPRITGMVTVTGADVSSDLKHARVFVTIRGDERQRDETLDGLRSLASHLRHVVGRNLRLRVAPEISFIYDETIERASRIDALLQEVKNATNSGGDDGGR
jgi:ribosome-binding factor A